jgi:jasmonate ZIM domain-containing protein
LKQKFNSRPSSENLSETAPLTIFYNGTVSVFEAPRDKAENILKLALERTFDSMNLAAPSSDQQQLLDTLNGDLPIARRKSLQRFLEKRKER